MVSKDYLGNSIEVGDEIVFTLLNYREFRKGKILKVTDKMCKIGYGKDYQAECKQFHRQVIKLKGLPNGE